MCHESTSVALPETIGVPVGTVKIEDFADTDCMFFFAQSVGVNSPRMLHQLQEVRERGVPIIKGARPRALHQSAMRAKAAVIAASMNAWNDYLCCEGRTALTHAHEPVSCDHREIGSSSGGDSSV
jgi:hypothetical protein